MIIISGNEKHQPHGLFYGSSFNHYGLARYYGCNGQTIIINTKGWGQGFYMPTANPISFDQIIKDLESNIGVNFLIDYHPFGRSSLFT